MLVITAVLCPLALINTVVEHLDHRPRRPTAACRLPVPSAPHPEQTAAGLSVAQLLPAIPGVVAGIPAGLGLYLAASHGTVR
jgi:putative ABC transport system permease protein